MEEDRADVFLTYCTNAILAVAESPDLQILEIPAELNIGANGDPTVLSDAEEPQALAVFILSEEGQSILERFGFGTLG